MSQPNILLVTFDKKTCVFLSGGFVTLMYSLIFLYVDFEYIISPDWSYEHLIKP